eukprot:5340481-Pyramimonas_sp.AAC.1
MQVSPHDCGMMASIDRSCRPVSCPCRARAKLFCDARPQQERPGSQSLQLHHSHVSMRSALMKFAQMAPRAYRQALSPLPWDAIASTTAPWYKLPADLCGFPRLRR